MIRKPLRAKNMWTPSMPMGRKTSRVLESALECAKMTNKIPMPRKTSNAGKYLCFTAAGGLPAGLFRLFISRSGCVMIRLAAMTLNSDVTSTGDAASKPVHHSLRTRLSSTGTVELETSSVKREPTWENAFERPV